MARNNNKNNGSGGGAAGGAKKSKGMTANDRRIAMYRRLQETSRWISSLLLGWISSLLLGWISSLLPCFPLDQFTSSRLDQVNNQG